MIGDEEMPKIIWKGIIKSEKDFPTADIPKNAKKLDSEEDMKKIQIKALPFMIPSVLLCFICMFVKTFIACRISIYRSNYRIFLNNCSRIITCYRFP